MEWRFTAGHLHGYGSSFFAGTFDGLRFGNSDGKRIYFFRDHHFCRSGTAFGIGDRNGVFAAAEFGCGGQRFSVIPGDEQTRGVSFNIHLANGVHFTRAGDGFSLAGGNAQACIRYRDLYGTCLAFAVCDGSRVIAGSYIVRIFSAQATRPFDFVWRNAACNFQAQHRVLSVSGTTDRLFDNEIDCHGRGFIHDIQAFVFRTYPHGAIAVDGHVGAVLAGVIFRAAEGRVSAVEQVEAGEHTRNDPHLSGSVDIEIGDLAFQVFFIECEVRPFVAVGRLADFAVGQHVGDRSVLADTLNIVS